MTSQAPETKNGGACCSLVAIEYAPVPGADGRMTARWECVRCRAEYGPIAWYKQRIVDLENEVRLLLIRGWVQ